MYVCCEFCVFMYQHLFQSYHLYSKSLHESPVNIIQRYHTYVHVYVCIYIGVCVCVWSLLTLGLHYLENLEKEMEMPPVFLPGKSHGQRRLADYSLWGHKSQPSS